MSSEYVPIFAPTVWGDGISQGREHARGAITPGTQTHQGQMYTQATALGGRTTEVCHGTNLVCAPSRVGGRTTASHLEGAQASVVRGANLACAPSNLGGRTSEFDGCVMQNAQQNCK